MPVRSEAAPTLTFIPFANERVNAEAATTRYADEAGRLTRALPLWLAEAFLMTYDVRTTFLLYAAKGHGPVVFGQPLSVASLAGVVAKSSGPRIVVSGSLLSDGLRVDAWDVDTQAQLASIKRPLDADLGELAAGLERELAN